jgi:phosphate transport system permease protein
MNAATARIQVGGSRRAVDRLMTVLCGAGLLFAFVPLCSLLYLVISRGLPSVNWTFLTALPKPVGETGGGVGNGLLGSALLTLMASVLGLPAGIGAGIYLASHGEGTFGKIVRFLAEVLSAVPSVVVGLAVYGLVVAPFHHFSALAGGVALAILMIPTLARSTEEVVKLVPHSLYEASLALGVPEWRSSLLVVTRTALGGIATAACLAMARAAGETAPLLFTALSNQFWNVQPTQPTASLPVQIYNYATSPYPDWQAQAWGAALVLLMFVGALNLLARVISKRAMLS